jgi:hypothetical protein
MRIRRAVVTLVTVTALSGGVGALSGCSNPSNSGTGTPADKVTDSSATAPSSSSLGATASPSSSG